MSADLHSDAQTNSSTQQSLSSSGWESVLETVAADLYRIGSMLLGESEETILLIEQALATIHLPSCNCPAEVEHGGRMALAAGAVALLARRDAAALAAPEGDFGPAGCIEDDELDAAGVTRSELEQMLASEDARSLRGWLEGLAAPSRIIFVLRAVAGLSSAEVAEVLAEHGGPAAEQWTPDSVRHIFRQALCSLASQLLHASNTR